MTLRRDHRRRPTRSGLAVLAGLSLLATACGSDDPSEVPAASPSDGELTEGQPADDQDAGHEPEAEPEAEAEPGGTPTTDTAPSTTAPSTTAPPTTTVATTTPPAPDPLFESVIGPALDRTTGDASYAMTMGMHIVMSIEGIRFDMGDPDAVLAEGTVDGGRQHIVMHLGDFMTSMFDSLITAMIESGEVPDDEIELANEMLDEMFGALEGQTIESWFDADAQTMVMDMSALFSGWTEALGGVPIDELGPAQPLVDGPVLVRLDEYGDAFSDLVGQLGLPTDIATPDQTLAMLGGLTGIAEVGPGQVGPAPVTVYTGTVDLGAMFGELGFDFAELAGGDPALDELGSVFDDFTMEITMMIDVDGLMRRVEIFADLGEMMAGLDPSAAEELGEMTMSIWTEYDRYGESFPFDPPPATDITDVFGELTDLGF